MTTSTPAPVGPMDGMESTGPESQPGRAHTRPELEVGEASGSGRPAVIGLDLSITATGIAWADDRLTTAADKYAVGDQRLAIIRMCVGSAVGDPDPATALVVIEDLPTHARAAGITGMVHGVVRLLLRDREVPYALVTPATLKKYATGRGNATKADMRMALFQRAGIDERDDNRVDAWWLRAAGLDHLGHPPVKLPAAHRAALGKVAWPNPLDDPETPDPEPGWRSI